MAADEPLHGLLPLFLNDRLDEADVKRFREHLESCAECRDEKAFLEDVRKLLQQGGEVLADHPEPDRLLAAQRGALAADEVAEIKRHLELCLTCAAEMRWIESDGVVVAEVNEGRAGPRSGWHGGWVAGLAAAVVLALLVPVLRGSREQPRFMDSQFVRRSELAGNASIVTLARDAAEWFAHFPVDASPADFPCTIEIVDAEGRGVAQTVVKEPTSLVGGLYVLFHCPSSACPPGTYTMRLEAAGGELLETIPFEVRQAD